MKEQPPELDTGPREAHGTPSAAELLRSPERASPAGLTDLEILADILSWHIKQNHPDVARKFSKIEGQARRDRLNYITREIVKVLIKAMNGKIWNKK